MEMAGALWEALERAYRAFAGIATPRYLRAPPYRNGEQILRTLTSKPLRALAVEELGPYSGWAMTTVGFADEYRHFLPRILELATSDQTYIGFEPAIIASKLKYAGWMDWPAEQQAAVRGVFEAAFRSGMGLHPDQDESAGSWLCGWACLDLPVEGLLAAWRLSSSLHAALQLAWFVMTEADGAGAGGALSGSFWEEVDPALCQAVGAWLMSRATSEQLAAAYDHVSPEDKWRIDEALPALKQGTAKPHL
jgi:hypothetical protein